MGDDVPEVYGTPPQADEALVHARAHTTLLAAIHKRLEPTKVPFRVQVPAIAANQIAQPFMSAAAGEILTVQNPTPNPVTVDLFENDGGNTVLKVTVAGNDYKALYVPFFGRLFARGGAGMIVSGNVTGNN